MRSLKFKVHIYWIFIITLSSAIITTRKLVKTKTKLVTYTTKNKALVLVKFPAHRAGTGMRWGFAPRAAAAAAAAAARGARCRLSAIPRTSRLTTRHSSRLALRFRLNWSLWDPTRVTFTSDSLHTRWLLNKFVLCVSPYLRRILCSSYFSLFPRDCYCFPLRTLFPIADLKVRCCDV